MPEPPDGSWVPEQTFATRLIELRKAKGWTQAQAAEACGLDDGSWSNWENGTRPRRMDEIVRQIAQATGVSRGWLMWGTDTSAKGGSDLTPRILVGFDDSYRATLGVIGQQSFTFSPRPPRHADRPERVVA